MKYQERFCVVMDLFHEYRTTGWTIFCWGKNKIQWEVDGSTLDLQLLHFLKKGNSTPQIYFFPGQNLGNEQNLATRCYYLKLFWKIVWQSVSDSSGLSYLWSLTKLGLQVPAKNKEPMVSRDKDATIRHRKPTLGMGQLTYSKLFFRRTKRVWVSFPDLSSELSLIGIFLCGPV